MRMGFCSDYWVIEWADGFDPNLRDLVPHFPEMVLGHRVVIASCDSGSFRPDQDELAQGWSWQDEVAVSPCVRDVSDLPMPGFDEWYVFDAEISGGRYRSFVNRYGFAPLNEMDPETHSFWEQVARFRPLHVIGAGTPTMFFVTRDEAIFRRVCLFDGLSGAG